MVDQPGMDALFFFLYQGHDAHPSAEGMLPSPADTRSLISLSRVSPRLTLLHELSPILAIFVSLLFEFV